MEPFIEAEFDNGLIRRWQEPLVPVANKREVLVEIDVCLDDLSQGLWLEIRHFRGEFGEEESGESQDARGARCGLLQDYYLGLLDANDLKRLVLLKKDGDPLLIRFSGELVNLQRLRAKMRIYGAGEEGSEALVPLVGSLISDIQRVSFEPKTPEELCGELGISEKLYQEGELWRQSAEAAKEEGNGSEEGEGVVEGGYLEPYEDIE